MKCRRLPHNGKMLSLDVDSLFTKVPVTETIEFLKRKLPTWNLNLPIDPNSFVKLVELCVTDNVLHVKMNSIDRNMV